ncbi:hypothetical protein CANARDRAFT_7425 [[Candida] arabinofermentans NRRL YB-2248]|uniref:Ribonuclease H2 subunit B n=1 Tax=[Candida] arabinofermentans NRRL YB-2248 TaxID=983967 RepID=A0A1E4T2U6_9ASCO|nr:hypothetical protein CANARDRAFT_7425 [[Candida] arabinofermentans NRRL YB-2248]
MTEDSVLSEIESSCIRLVVLPSNAPTENFTSLILNHPSTHKATEFLINGSKLYELNKIAFKDYHNKKQRLTKQNKPLKSILLTNTTPTNTDGIIIGKDCEILVATEFSLIYLLLDFFIDYLKKEKVRILNYDDLVELFEESESLGELIRQVDNVDFKKHLDKICELIDEADDIFYKVSMELIMETLKITVSRIIGTFPESLNVTIVRKLNLPSLKPSPEVIELSQIKSSIDLLSSYVSRFYLDKLIQEYNFDKLDEYMKEYKRVEEENKIAEDNLNNLNASLTNMPSKGNPKKRKAEAKKNEVKKVAAGKGALDMFFKKPK